MPSVYYGCEDADRDVEAQMGISDYFDRFLRAARAGVFAMLSSNPPLGSARDRRVHRRRPAAEPVAGGVGALE
jgi:hypothetical protein